MLSFDYDIGGALQKTCESDHDNNTMHLVQVVRRETFQQEQAMTMLPIKYPWVSCVNEHLNEYFCFNISLITTFTVHTKCIAALSWSQAFWRAQSIYHYQMKASHFYPVTYVALTLNFGITESNCILMCEYIYQSQHKTGVMYNCARSVSLKTGLILVSVRKSST